MHMRCLTLVVQEDGANINSQENVSMLTGGRDPLCSNKIII